MSSSKGEKTRRRILKFILTYTASHQQPPTMQEVKELAGFRSEDALGRHLKTLKEQGLIDWDMHRNHMITIPDRQNVLDVLRETANSAVK